MVILYLPDLYGASNNGEEWVDPDPLSKINRDRASERVIKEPRNPSQETENCMKIEETSAIKQELKLCNQLLNNCSKQLQDFKCNLSSTLLPKERSPDESAQKQECVQDKLYMKRFINILLKASKLHEDMPQNLDTHLYITVTPEQLKVLQQFSKGDQDVTLQELDHVMSSVFLSSKSNIFFEEYIPWPTVAGFFQSREMLVALVLGCLPMFLIWKVLNGHSMFRIMTMFLMSVFIISFSVTYCRMYKQAEIKQYAAIKANTGVPAECRPPSERTWMESSWNHIKNVFRSSFGYHDECQKYYETVMLDPFLEVTPSIVLSEMVAGFLLHPSGLLGAAVADYSKNVLGGLPWGVNLVVLLASFILVTAIIIASCGGVIRLPWYLGGFELSGRRPQERITAGPQKSQVIEQVEQSSGCSVLNEAAISNLMQTADSTDTGLVIMNVTGIRRLLSAGSTTVIHRDVIEDIQQSSPEKKFSHNASEQSDQSRSEDVTPVSGCCGESQPRSHHAVLVDETATVGSGCLHQPLRKNQTEELKLRRRAATCISKDKHIQIQRTEVVEKHTKAVQQIDGTEELAPADKDALSDYRAASTVDGCNVWESAVEEEVNRHRSSSIDVSDEEIGFVKL